MKYNAKKEETAKLISLAMRQAREMCRMSRDDVADMLHIMPNELVQDERCLTQIPLGILERVFVMGYKMMRVRMLENKYHCQRKALCKIKRVVAIQKSDSVSSKKCRIPCI